MNIPICFKIRLTSLENFTNEDTKIIKETFIPLGHKQRYILIFFNFLFITSLVYTILMCSYNLMNCSINEIPFKKKKK